MIECSGQAETMKEKIANGIMFGALQNCPVRVTRLGLWLIAVNVDLS